MTPRMLSGNNFRDMACRAAGVPSRVRGVRALYASLKFRGARPIIMA